MEKVTRTLIEYYVRKLPAEEESFQPAQLKSLGFPGFVVKRVALEIENQLGRSVQLPDTDWANVETPRVRSAWNDFVHEIRMESRLPRKHAAEVLDLVIKETLNLLIEPRKAIPVQLFGSDESLDRETLEHRVRGIYVHQYLAAAPLKYMIRKNLFDLDREQCINVLSIVDEALTGRYDTSDWLENLEPLFELAGDTLHFSLLQRFFEEKGLNGIAPQIEEAGEMISRTALKRVLASADMNFEDLPKEKPEGKSRIPFDSNESRQPEVSADRETEPEQSPGDVSGGSLPPIPGKQRSEKQEQTQQRRENKSDGADRNEVPLHSRFMLDVSESVETFEREEQEDPADTFNAMYRNTGPDEDMETAAVRLGRAASEPEDAAPVTPDDSDAEEQMENVRKVQEEETESDQTPDERDGDLLISEVRVEVDAGHTEDAVELIRWLDGEAERFRDGIFRGSEEIFESAVEDLAELDEWSEASHYIQNEIFYRNRVDMYDDVAVDFTDALHDYFIKNKSMKSNS